jgi:hypothetical protein
MGTPPDAEHDGRLQRAYGALLGDDYERNLTEHVQLTSLAQTLAKDMESAMEWTCAGVQIAATDAPPLTYRPMLITDAGAALFGLESWFRERPSIGERIDAFVEALKPHFVVVSYATGDKNIESFLVYGTDGPTLREVHFMAERKRRGGTKITKTVDRSGVPWEASTFLSPVSRTLRELNNDPAHG